MSSISLKTFSLLSHLGHRYEVHLCAVERTSKKLSHNSEHSKASLSPQADGQRGVRHARLFLQCCCCWQQPQRVPSQPKNEQKFTQLPASSSHCVVTDTFSLTPCAHHPPSVNCCWRPASQDFLKIRFVLQRNQIFLGREILFPNLTNPFAAGDSESVAGMRLTGSLGFPDRRLRGTTRRKDWEPDWREAGLPTIRGLRAENLAVIKARTRSLMLLKF